MVPFLGPLDPFPALETAREDMGGLLAVGADLSPARILDAYSHGIFPWGTVESLPLWYSPDPRMVLFPDELRISRTLRRTLRRGAYEVRLDSDFLGVMRACAGTPRPGQDGTWITPDMIEAYCRLHELGWAHSVETYVDGQLVGGLYGLAIGGMFYGESMFSRQSDVSKIAFAHLVRFISGQGFGMIDCQMRTDHLASLGGREIPRRDFADQLRRLIALPHARGPWPADGARYDWS